jgi:GNAT-like C-terminal domain/N-acyltransferase N-terminal domain
MDVRAGASHTAITAAQVNKRLGLGGTHAGWVAKLDALDPPAELRIPNADHLMDLLTRLKVSPEDSAEVIRTMPSPEHDLELWWLLERSEQLLARSLAHRELVPEAFPPLPPSLARFLVHLILISIPAIRDCHREFGIPDDVSWETLSYLSRAMNEYRTSHGAMGVHLSQWDWLRFSGWLYQVGRLEVTPYRLRTHPPEAGPLFWYDEETAAQLGPGFRKGDPAVGIHVAAADPLTPEACDDSLQRIRKAFSRMYPGEPPRVATCTSWLLDDQLSEYLPAASNIIAFQRRFELVPGVRDNDDAILHFVFGSERPQELQALPQRTTLERAVVHHLQQGRHWRMRTGWLKITDLEPMF